MPQQQLLDHQAGLDGLAQPDVVGQQQVRPRRLQARGAAARAGRPRRSRRCGTAPGRRFASAEVTAPHRTASTNAAKRVRVVERLGSIVSAGPGPGRPCGRPPAPTPPSAPRRAGPRRATGASRRDGPADAPRRLGCAADPAPGRSQPPRSSRVPRPPDPGRVSAASMRGLQSVRRSPSLATVVDITSLAQSRSSRFLPPPWSDRRHPNKLVWDIGDDIVSARPDLGWVCGRACQQARQ